MPTSSQAPAILALDDRAATDPSQSGGKAAALAGAVADGLRVPDGVVLPVRATTGVAAGEVEGLRESLARVRDRLGDGPLVARSSSPQEDQADASMAGRFESVAGIETLDDLVEAVATVLASRDRVAREEDIDDLDVAVLVQRQVSAAVSGVLFTVDPVTGNRDRMVISAVRGAPEALVSGQAAATRHLLDHDGTMLERVEGEDGAALDDHLRRELVALGRRVQELFGAPQDVEWAADADGTVFLLQSRPVTETGGDAATDRRHDARDDDPVYGPGPVAETFPEPLAPLEVDLWVPPLRAALRSVFDVLGVASDGWLDRSDIVTVQQGWTAVDLDLFGSAPRDRSWVRRFFAFGKKARRLMAAWRVGRIRAQLQDTARAVLDTTDRRLSEVPAMEELSDWQLLGLLDHGREALRSLHAHEALSGVLVSDGQGPLTGPSVALRVLATARRDGHDDDEIVQRWPIVLALTAPHVGPPQLPGTPDDLPPRPITARDDDPGGVLREALRLRVRWVQELQARAARLLASRLIDRGTVPDLDTVRAMQLEELRAVVESEGEAVAAVASSQLESGPPLPRAFQLRGDELVAVTGGDEGGSGAGGGRGRGPAHLGDDPQDGDVLVVSSLDPSLAPLLGRLGGLVSSTGSVLSHVAILAREAGVPTVVGVHGATERFEEGQVLEVDGDAGSVEPGEDH